jgi:nucleoside-diphosphate-sugar epimerase
MKLGMGGYKDIILDYKVCRWVEQNPPNEMFVVMSSCAVDYPQDPYCVVKRMLEEFAHNLYQKSDVPVTILRPFSGYGYDQSEQYPFRSIMDRTLAFQQPLQVWGGSQMRDWLHIDDLINGIMFAVDGKFSLNTPVELGSGNAIDFYTFAKHMAKTVAKITKKEYAPEIVSVNKECSSHKREANPTMANKYGWHPNISLLQGMSMEVTKAIHERKLIY